MRTFNTTGKCIPSIHYMVDISHQVDAAAALVHNGNYFCINRGRQYGKTTTLAFLKRKLEEDGYAVFSLSFEGLDDSAYQSADKLAQYSLLLMGDILEFSKMSNFSDKGKEILGNIPDENNKLTLRGYCRIISSLCQSDKVVLIIDEVDQAGNYPEFIKFLGQLRDMYLNRDERPTFQSVILAGVYDIKNLKLKIHSTSSVELRPEEQHQYNSPWNIAVPFDVDMSLPADGIAGMLREYKTDHNLQFDETLVGQMIYDYTSGYPFLASRICQIIDTEHYSWDREGVLKGVNSLLKEPNTLFDDMMKKIVQFPRLEKILHDIVFGGKRITFNYYDQDINLAYMFNFIKQQDGAAVIACRIFETWLYNFFISNEKTTDIYQNGEYDKNQFVHSTGSGTIHNGYLDVRLIMERFCVHFNDIYRPGKDDKFVEEYGRKIFLTYLRPIINGVGNYYCEAQTRNLTRTDVVIDYRGQQYVIELKIWRGQSYNERGENQLSEYLDYFHLKTGYMLSFCFNKEKKVGLHEVHVGNRVIYETVV